MEDINFFTMNHVFKVLAIIQLLLFIILFFITLLFKLYQNYHSAKEKKLIAEINKLLLKFDTLSFKDIKRLKAHRTLCFEAFYRLEKQAQFSNNQIIQNIMISLFLPFINKDIASSYWPSRNNVALNYQLKSKYFKNMSSTEELFLIQLVADPVPLVSINAAIAICYSPTQKTMDSLIDIFSQRRRAQYDLLTEVLNTSALKVIPLITQRLNHEKNIYMRVFCYRMLRQLPKIDIDLARLESDINSKNIDLSLAALSYISYAQTHDYKDHLIKGLNSDFWEVRARAAKLIGYTKDAQLVDVLLPLLMDSVWWVRYRAAEALSHMGPAGLGALKAQKIDVDKFAFEMAQQQLQLFNTKKKGL